jgi:hypothetical protein
MHRLKVRAFFFPAVYTEFAAGRELLRMCAMRIREHTQWRATRINVRVYVHLAEAQVHLYEEISDEGIPPSATRQKNGSVL